MHAYSKLPFVTLQPAAECALKQMAATLVSGPPARTAMPCNTLGRLDSAASCLAAICQPTSVLCQCCASKPLLAALQARWRALPAAWPPPSPRSSASTAAGGHQSLLWPVPLRLPPSQARCGAASPTSSRQRLQMRLEGRCCCRLGHARASALEAQASCVTLSPALLLLLVEWPQTCIWT